MILLYEIMVKSVADLGMTQEELVPCEQGRRRESSLYLVFFGFCLRKEILENAFFKKVSVRACLRACVCVEAHSAIPKLRGSKKRQISLM